MSSEASAGASLDSETQTDVFFVDYVGTFGVSSMAADSDPLAGSADASASTTIEWAFVSNPSVDSFHVSLSGGASAADSGLAAAASSSVRLQYVGFYLLSDQYVKITLGSDTQSGARSLFSSDLGDFSFDSSTPYWAGKLKRDFYYWWVEDAVGVSGNDSRSFHHTFDFAVVPEPTSMVVLGGGLLLVTRNRRRRLHDARRSRP